MKSDQKYILMKAKQNIEAYFPRRGNWLREGHPVRTVQGGCNAGGTEIYEK